MDDVKRRILHSMGVDSKETKDKSSQSLDDMLESAINRGLAGFGSIPPLDITNVPKWSSKDKSQADKERKELQERFNNNAFTITEKMESLSGLGASDGRPGGPYLEVRELFADMASSPKSYPYAIQAANSDECGVLLRVVATRRLKSDGEDMPLMQVKWMFTEQRNLPSKLEQIKDLLYGGQQEREGVKQFKFDSLDSVHLLRIILEHNAKKLTQSSIERAKRSWNFKEDHELSVIPPHLPISTKQADSVRKEGAECANCGARGATARCTACRTAYCNVKCQRQHWNVHKKECVRANQEFAEDGMLQVEFKPFDMGGAAGIMGMNQPGAPLRMLNSSSHKLPSGLPSSGFIIKVQVPMSDPSMGPSAAPMMIYPRNRKFTAMMTSNMAGYDRVADIVRSRGYMGMKMYMNAKRASDTQLQINLNTFPDQNQPW